MNGYLSWWICFLRWIIYLKVIVNKMENIQSMNWIPFTKTLVLLIFPTDKVHFVGERKCNNLYNRTIHSTNQPASSPIGNLLPHSRGYSSVISLVSFVEVVTRLVTNCIFNCMYRSRACRHNCLFTEPLQWPCLRFLPLSVVRFIFNFVHILIFLRTHGMAQVGSDN